MRYKLRILNRNKFIIAVLLSICVASRIYAVAFTSVGSIGIQNATVCEELNSKYSSLSRLNWCIPLSISLGLNEELLISGFVSCVSINTSLPGKLGTMIDCDYYLSGVVSQYSSHSAHIDTDCSFCIDLVLMIFLLFLLFLGNISAENIPHGEGMCKFLLGDKIRQKTMRHRI